MNPKSTTTKTKPSESAPICQCQGQCQCGKKYTEHRPVYVEIDVEKYVNALNDWD